MTSWAEENLDHVRQAAAVVHEIIRGVLGLTGLSEKKNVHAQVADILGILVDCKPFVIVSDASPTGMCAALYTTR